MSNGRNNHPGNRRPNGSNPQSMFDPLDVMAQAAHQHQLPYSNQQRNMSPAGQNVGYGNMQGSKGHVAAQMGGVHPQHPSHHQQQTQPVDERVLWDLLQDHTSTNPNSGHPFIDYAQAQSQTSGPPYTHWTQPGASGYDYRSNPSYYNQYQQPRQQQQQRQQLQLQQQRQQEMQQRQQSVHSFNQQSAHGQRPYDALPVRQEPARIPPTEQGSDSLSFMSGFPEGDASIADEEQEDDKEQLRLLLEEFNPKASIPLDISSEEFARQCTDAAVSSRLSPYALSPDEYTYLRKHITTVQVSTYLNIRNAILRLWIRNPLVAVARDEAAGCAKESRYFALALFAYEFLLRRGYINFGCVEVPIGPEAPSTERRKTVVIIGAGIAGIGCARQLEGLFRHFCKPHEVPPRVLILEAKNRLGGRIYSHPFKSKGDTNLPEGKRSTVDLGGQIITGFERGNPLSVLIRGQLALHLHSLRDASILYDIDGKEVEKYKDVRAESLFNDLLDRASIFKSRPNPPRIAEGDKQLIDTNRDASDGGLLLHENEDEEVTGLVLKKGDSTFSASVDKMTGRAATATGSSNEIPATQQLRSFGFTVNTDSETDATEPQAIGPDGQSSLGQTMNQLLGKFQEISEISAQDLRLVNWHYANLEYANAANVKSLSLRDWDQDDGNEFRGEHAMIIGGYTQVPRGLAMAPSQLEIKYNAPVKQISYQEEGDMQVKVECENGETIEADAAVCSVPLGVLKQKSIKFAPPLPDWKNEAIERLGFGLLNKIVLVYGEAFWDTEKDMVGLLREPVGEDDTDQANYEKMRGRFYLFWNCTPAAGRPVLVALMAGEAAHQAEDESDEDLIKDATSQLAKMYSGRQIPKPKESVVTRWSKDPYCGGSYSYVSPQATGEDYDLIGKSIGESLYFCGEASCRTHPATVHGAYLSGLRSAGEVLEQFYGDIKLPTRLIPERIHYGGLTTSAKKRKAHGATHAMKARDLEDSRVSLHEEKMEAALLNTLGPRPSKPTGRPIGNPFLIFQKSAWDRCKGECEEERQRDPRRSDVKVGRNEIRAALGQMWRKLPDEEKQPYLDQAEHAKYTNRANAQSFKSQLDEYDRQSEEFRKRYDFENPSRPSEEELREAHLADREQEQVKRMKSERKPSIDANNDDDSELVKVCTFICLTCRILIMKSEIGPTEKQHIGSACNNNCVEEKLDFAVNYLQNAQLCCGLSPED